MERLLCPVYVSVGHLSELGPSASTRCPQFAAAAAAAAGGVAVFPAGPSAPPSGLWGAVNVARVLLKTAASCALCTNTTSR